MIYGKEILRLNFGSICVLLMVWLGGNIEVLSERVYWLLKKKYFIEINLYWLGKEL